MNESLALKEAVYYILLSLCTPLCAVAAAYGLGRVHGKKEALERERRIRE